jgi:hypothetical protein
LICARRQRAAHPESKELGRAAELFRDIEAPC